MMNVEQWPALVRWIVALPAALLAVVLVSFPIHWMIMIATAYNGGSDESGLSLWSLPPESLERCGQALFAPIAAILTLGHVAPSYRIYIAGIAAVAWALLIGVGLTVAAQSGNYVGAGWIEFVAIGILGAGGTLYALYTVHEKDMEGRALMSGH